MWNTADSWSEPPVEAINGRRAMGPPGRSAGAENCRFAAGAPGVCRREGASTGLPARSTVSSQAYAGGGSARNAIPSDLPDLARPVNLAHLEVHARETATIKGLVSPRGSGEPRPDLGPIPSSHGPGTKIGSPRWRGCRSEVHRDHRPSQLLVGMRVKHGEPRSEPSEPRFTARPMPRPQAVARSATPCAGRCPLAGTAVAPGATG
jgi:hypothetical protein